jgi:antitoxin HicB
MEQSFPSWLRCGPRMRARTGTSCAVAVMTPDSDVPRVDLRMTQRFALRMQVVQVENGQYLATSNDLPGLVAQGRTVEEALEIAADVARRLLDSYREQGDPVPATLRTLGPAFEVDLPVTM